MLSTQPSFCSLRSVIDTDESDRRLELLHECAEVRNDLEHGGCGDGALRNHPARERSRDGGSGSLRGALADAGEKQPTPARTLGIMCDAQSREPKALEHLLGREESELVDFDRMLDAR